MVIRSFEVSVTPWPEEMTCKHRAKSQKTFRKIAPAIEKAVIYRLKDAFLENR